MIFLIQSARLLTSELFFLNVLFVLQDKIASYIPQTETSLIAKSDNPC
jgi:hypothetical protein